MRTIARRLLIGVAVVGLLLLVALGGIYQALRQPPRFYEQALHTPPGENSARLEEQALALHNQLMHVGRWEVRFSQDEINDWLASELPEKFPQSLPAGISQPRVALEDNLARVAVHYERDGVATVVSLAGDVYLTKQPNEVAVRIAQARAGLIPVPLSRFLQEISQRAARANLRLRWSETQGTPVALLRLPLDADDRQPRRVILERVSFSAGQLLVAGRTEVQSPAGDAAVTAGQPEVSEIRQR